jgi:hypothetical protein
MTTADIGPNGGINRVSIITMIMSGCVHFCMMTDRSGRSEYTQAIGNRATAIITMRDLFILTAKLLIYIRDLVIRFRQ